MVAQGNVLRQGEGHPVPLVGHAAGEGHGVRVQLHQGEGELRHRILLYPAGREQGGPVGAVGQVVRVCDLPQRRACGRGSLLRGLLGPAGHQRAPHQGGAQHQSQGNPPPPGGRGGRQGPEALLQPPDAAGELTGQRRRRPGGHEGQQGRAVALPPALVPSGQGGGVAADLHVPLRRAAEGPHQGIEPVQGAHPQQQGLVPQVAAFGVGGLVGQGVGPLLSGEALGQQDAGPHQPHQHRGGQEGAGLHQNALVLPRRGAPPAGVPPEGGVPGQLDRQHPGGPGAPHAKGQLRQGEGETGGRRFRLGHTGLASIWRALRQPQGH